MNKRTMKLNCDMGESFGQWNMGNDELVMPHIDLANIACGFHASDPQVMNKTVQLAIKHDVTIGAHPSYPDKQGFGRRSIAMRPDEITNLVIYQIGALKGMCLSHNTDVNYVKPHGALYNDMINDLSIFEAIVDAVSCFNIPLMTLATADNQPYLDIADKYEVPLLFEAFADRRYLASGHLAPRSYQGSVLTTKEDIVSQVQQIAVYKKVRTIDGFLIPIEADTICVHGDNEQGIALIKNIKQQLEP